MPLDATMIKLYYTGGGTANTSLGGSATAVECGTSINSIYDDITYSESLVGRTEYRAIDAKNEHGSKSITDAVVFIDTETSSSGTTVEVAYDSVGTQSIANETTAPVGLSFVSTAVSRATGISVGTPWTFGTKKRIWLKRIVSAGVTAVSPDSGQLRVIGDRLA